MAVALVLLAAYASIPRQGIELARKLTLDLIYGSPGLSGNDLIGVKWAPNEDAFTYYQPSPQNATRYIWSYDLKTRTKAVLIDSNRTLVLEEPQWVGPEKRFFVPNYLWSPTGKEILLPSGNDLYLYDIASAAVRRLTNDEEVEDDPHFSSDGHRISFIKNHNIHVLDIETGIDVPVTTDGREHVFVGQFDWVYQEEFASSRTGFFWAPDGQHIAFFQLKMGLEEKADSFAFIHRFAFFQDEDAGNAYMKNPRAVVFRLTPKEPASFLPYEVQQLRVRGTGNTMELDLMGALNDLRQAIIAKYSTLNPTELKTSIWLLEGFDGIQREIDVIGENRDTTYLWTDRFTLKDDPNEFLIVYGINHAATGKVVYSNFGVYGSDILNGVGAVASQSLSGTAEDYIPGHPAAKYLYAWKVARRSQGDPRCLEVPWGIGAAGIDLDKECYVGFRAYVEKETKVGPFWSEILYDRTIKFSPSK